MPAGRAAQAMRQYGFEGRIVLIGEEPHVPYERPPLSKELIVTDAGLEKVRLHEAAWYAENRIDLIAGNAATSIDAAGKCVELADGRAIGFDKLMLTTGARVRRPAGSGGPTSTACSTCGQSKTATRSRRGSRPEPRSQ